MFAQIPHKLAWPSTRSPEQPNKSLHVEERLAQRLYKLDRSSPRFSEQLDELLHDEEWVGRLQPLPEGELVELIDYLDNVGFIQHQLNPTHYPTGS